MFYRHAITPPCHNIHPTMLHTLITPQCSWCPYVCVCVCLYACKCVCVCMRLSVCVSEDRTRKIPENNDPLKALQANSPCPSREAINLMTCILTAYSWDKEQLL